MSSKKSIINSINRKKNEFIDVAQQVNPFFNEEGVNLDFTGYIKTLNQYISCDECDLDALDILIRDLNLWFKYFGELEAVVESFKLSYENKLKYIKSFSLTPKIEKELNLAKYKVQRTKLFLKHIKVQIKMFNKLHYHCISMYNDTCEQYLYRY